MFQLMEIQKPPPTEEPRLCRGLLSLTPVTLITDNYSLSTCCLELKWDTIFFISCIKSFLNLLKIFEHLLNSTVEVAMFYYK